MRNIAFGMLWVFAQAISAQDIQYFTPHFTSVEKTKTDYVRRFDFSDSTVMVSDLDQGRLKLKASIMGTTDKSVIHSYIGFVKADASELWDKGEFGKLRGEFDIYRDSTIARRIIAIKNKVYYVDGWDENRQQCIIAGYGKCVGTSDQKGAKIYSEYADSLMISNYCVRSLQNDTIFYSVDTTAKPKDGLPKFYQEFLKIMKYPGLARLAGMEAIVFIQFTVERNGRLTEFKALTKTEFNFEEKTIKKLQRLPDWIPATYKGRNVKTQFVLPVKFTLT